MIEPKDIAAAVDMTGITSQTTYADLGICDTCGAEYDVSRMHCPACNPRLDVDEWSADDEDDVDILIRTSDHIPGEATHAATLDQHHRDGQLWASYQPAEARALLDEETYDRNPVKTCGRCGQSEDSPEWNGISFCTECMAAIPNEDPSDPIDTDAKRAYRRAWLDGIAYGLEHGSTGLRPRMELEEGDPFILDYARHIAQNFTAWAQTDDLVRALVGLPNGGNFTQVLSHSDQAIVIANATN